MLGSMNRPPGVSTFDHREERVSHGKKFAHMCSWCPGATATLDGREFECFDKCDPFPGASGSMSCVFDRTSAVVECSSGTLFLVYRLRLVVWQIAHALDTC